MLRWRVEFNFVEDIRTSVVQESAVCIRVDSCNIKVSGVEHTSLILKSAAIMIVLNVNATSSVCRREDIKRRLSSAGGACVVLFTITSPLVGISVIPCARAIWAVLGAWKINLSGCVCVV